MYLDGIAFSQFYNKYYATGNFALKRREISSEKNFISQARTMHLLCAGSISFANLSLSFMICTSSVHNFYNMYFPGDAILINYDEEEGDIQHIQESILLQKITIEK